MYPNSEPGPNFAPDPSNEVLNHPLLQSCVSEALACAQVLRTEQGVINIDSALLALVEATDDPWVASAIERDDYRLASLAGIARRTADASLGQSVITETIHLFGDKRSPSLLLTVAQEMDEPAALLAAISDPETCRLATHAFATRFEDLTIIDKIQDPKQREEALLTIIKCTTRSDISPFLDLLDNEQQQHAIGLRALMHEDVELAATITDIADRVQLLINIAHMRHDKQLDASVPELLAQITDDDPIKKATCLKQYMDLSGSNDEVHILHATALKIDDPIERAPFLAVVFARTRDPDVGQEVKDVLEAHDPTRLPYFKDELHAGLAIGLSSLDHALSIGNRTLRYDTARTIVLETDNLQVARDTARSLQDPGLLHDFALARNDMDLALEMANSTNNAVKINGINAVLELAFKGGNLDPILQIKDRFRYEHMIVYYLVEKDDLEAANGILDAGIRRKVQIGIAEKRGDLELAIQLDAREVVEYIERTFMANGSTGLPFDEIELIQEPVRRIHAYYAHPSNELVAAKAKILACIRQLPEGQRPYFLSTIAEATRDPLIAYEALYATQGAINNTQVIEMVARMIAVTKGQLLAGVR